MIQYDEYRLKLTAMLPELKELGEAVEIERLRSELIKLEESSAAPDFWSNLEASQAVLQKTKQLRDKIAA